VYLGDTGQGPDILGVNLNQFAELLDLVAGQFKIHRNSFKAFVDAHCASLV
jgi:hypothetical protein